MTDRRTVRRTGTVTPRDGVAEQLSGVVARSSGLMLAPETVQTLLQLVTATAVQAVPAAAGAGVTLVDEHGQRHSSAGTDEQVLRWDRLQHELDEGPCLTAYEQRRAVDVRDVAKGHLLAAERGRTGERYVLGGHDVAWVDLLARVAALAEVRHPLVVLPPEAAEATKAVAALLDEADLYCWSGDDLQTLVTPPDCVAYRRWCFAQVLDQLDGRHPVPWPERAAARGL